MSHLHKRIKAHQHMTLKEKENCQCELCKGLNVNKTRRKIEMPVQKSNIYEQSSKLVLKNKKEIKSENVSDTEYKYTTLTDTSDTS